MAAATAPDRAVYVSVSERVVLSWRVASSGAARRSVRRLGALCVVALLASFAPYANVVTARTKVTLKKRV